jgi:hypothetical protein
MAAKLGFAAKLYRLSTGSRASWGTLNATDGVYESATPPASLDEIPNCREVTIPLEDGLADTSTRGNNGFKSQLPTLTDVTIDIPMVFDETDADYTALLKAKLAKSVIALAFLSGDKATVGTSGFWADFYVHKMQKSEPIDGAQMMTFTVVVAYSTVAPQWVRCI